jgi:hypothetical protein
MEANAHKLPFLTAKARMKSRYGIEMELDDFIEKAYYIWRSIGNIAINQKSVEYVIPENNIITLPSDCEFLDSVRLKYNLYNADGFDSSGRKSTEKETTVSYDTIEDKAIKITNIGLEGLDVILEYSSIAVDPDGLPFLNDPEVEAIAANVAKQKAEIDLFRNIKGADSILQYIKPEADRLLIAARNDEKITDDGLNKLLDVKSSWDRKTFGEKFNFK